MTERVLNPIDLTGYLTFGKINVNDYVLELGRGADDDGKSGMVLSVYDSSGELLSRELCYDGDPGLTSAERAAIIDLFGEMSEAFPEWASAEEERQGSEAARRAAEGTASAALATIIAGLGTDSDELKTLIEAAGADPAQLKTRYGLFEAMLRLYRAVLSARAEDQAARDAAVSAAVTAESAAASASASAQAATAAVLGGFKDLLFYSNGDSVSFTFTPAGNEYREDYVTGDNAAQELDAAGYVTEDKTVLHVKIPLGKRLTYIDRAELTSFKAIVHNSGGYGLVSGFRSEGQDYLPYLVSKGIDKVQNCLHLIFRNSGRFNYLVNNQPVICRCVDISITLYGADGGGEAEV